MGTGPGGGWARERVSCGVSVDVCDRLLQPDEQTEARRDARTEEGCTQHQVGDGEQRAPPALPGKAVELAVLKELDEAQVTSWMMQAAATPFFTAAQRRKRT